MNNVIVTHVSPDLDAISATWLLIRYLPGWTHAGIEFVTPGNTKNNLPPDAQSTCVHVDTGGGKYDHHSIHERTSATQRVFEDLVEKGHIPPKHHEVLERLIPIITGTDHFDEALFPEAHDDTYMFFATNIIQGYKMQNQINDWEVVQFGFSLLNGVFNCLRQKINAEEEIKEGYHLDTYWGKSLVSLSNNSQLFRVAIKSGFSLVVVKDSRKGFIRISLSPKSNKNLKDLYKDLIRSDPHASWFYHASGRIIINGPRSKKGAVASSISVTQLTDIVLTYQHK